MGFDAKILSEPAGMVRCGAVVAGILAWVFNIIGKIPSSGYLGSWEVVYYWSVLLCTVIGLTLLLLGLFGMLENEIVQAVDKVFHALAAELLVVISLFLLVAVFDEHHYHENNGQIWAILSGFIGLIFGLLCAGLAYMLFKG